MESYLLGTLHTSRPGPNLFYVGEKKSQAGAIVPPNLGGEEKYGVP